ncbi:hypothetical protein [Shewanella aegiceratis]|uniref:hypothetical protein n=1 Tax=Shewanella aegiceratis TaxID=2864203 RepID=UPI001C65C637|nr:hypothetical protein [Shewanella aegiceratis]QYJ83028.1 hypothetical protein K0H80_03100 [Shewanella aegiceratis]
MRTFLNIPNAENKQLSEKFSFLLKCNDDCTADDFGWVAITVFDHWLYETGSVNVIEEASNAQKQVWDQTIERFLRQLVDLEQPLKYRYVGRNSNQKLRFSRFVKDGNMGEYVSSLFNDVYWPNLVFNRLGLNLWFEDNWTIHLKYIKQEDCLDMFKLASKLGLFVLPVYSADHLDNYAALSEYLSQQGLNQSLHRTVNLVAE